MRILQISKYYPPATGGLERVVYDICTGVRAAGYRCDVLCANNSRCLAIETENGDKIIRGGKWATVASTPVSPQMIRQYRHIADRYDVIHLHLPNPMANLLALTTRTRAKLVLHWHSDIIRQRLFLKLYAPFQRWLMERSDEIIATSQSYVDGSPWLYPYHYKTHVVPIGIDTTHLTADPAHVSAIKSRFPDRPIVFSLGRLTYYKGFEFLIRAAREIGNAWILIGGKGDLHSELETLIRTCGVDDRVVMLGDVPTDELGAYFAACDAFCLPSHVKSEAFGVVQLEAMASGKPVVSTAISGSGVSWVNKDGESGLVVEPADPEALAEAINRLLGDSKLAQRLGRGAQERYSAMFQKRQMIEGILRAYGAAASEPASRS